MEILLCLIFGTECWTGERLREKKFQYLILSVFSPWPLVERGRIRVEPLTKDFLKKMRHVGKAITVSSHTFLVVFWGGVARGL